MSEEVDLNGGQNIMQGDIIEEEETGPASIVPISEEQRNNLIQEANDMKNFFESFDQQFNDIANEYFFLLSADWLRKWKRYTSYDNVTRGNEPNPRWFGQVNPGQINENIINDEPGHGKYPDLSDYRNVFLKPELQDKRDYELITEAAWNYISRNYENTPIKRPSYMLPNGMKQVEVSLKQIQIVPINNSYLKDVDHKRTNQFKQSLVQASSQVTLGEFKNDLVQLCNASVNKSWFENQNTYYYTRTTITEDNLRLWKLDPTLTLQDFFKEVSEICGNSRTYDYQIEFKGAYLEKDKSIKLEEAQLAANDYLFIESRETNKGWNFYGDSAPILAKCEFCNTYGELPVQCACKKVAYCSENCRQSDKRFHKSRCDRAGDEEEEESKTLVEKSDSKYGLVGLQNLGNTCFMNSGLQCLSNIKELTLYFLRDKYLAEINSTNPLGTKGKLVKKYAAFLKHLWFGTSGVHSPWALKQAISEFQPMFSGYQQHDSQELLAFLIDGIHEDLNRVKNKPFTETIESEDQNDYEVAQKSWENHLKRNQSIIVDLLHGQYKSQITCPTCNRISITFDPFNSVSLPIPIKKEKELDFFFVHANNKSKALKVFITFSKTTHTVIQLKKEVAKLLGKNPNNFQFVFSTYHSKETVTDEETTMTNELRKKKKYKNLFALEIAEEDLKADPADRFDVDIHTTTKSTNYYGSEVHKPLSFIRNVSLRKSYTSRQIYQKVFKYYRFLFDENCPDEEKEEWLKLSDEEAFQKVWEEVEQKPFYLHIVTNSTLSDECFFCGERRCDNCKLQFNDSTTLAEILGKIKDSTYKFELEVVFDTPKGFSLDGLNGYIDLSKRKPSGNNDDTPKEKGVNIYDCFEQFEIPEQLGEENAWYCSKCKAHQKATKKMEIYKAPPILILHFKRFKSGNSIYRKGKITERIDFPTEELDISNYVINSELPMDYPVERIIPNFNPEISSDLNPGANLESSNNAPAETPQESGTMNIETEAGKDTTATSQTREQEGTSQIQVGKGPKQDLSLHYNLFAVVNHYGNMGFGHYTAYGKNYKDGRWHYFDDSRVSDEHAENVCTPAAYVMFYKRKGWEFNI